MARVKPSYPNQYAAPAKLASFQSSTGVMATRCEDCFGRGHTPQVSAGGLPSVSCDACGGRGWFDIKPCQPTQAPPGTVEKVAVMQARYANGQEIFNPADACHQSDNGVWHMLDRGGRPVGSEPPVYEEADEIDDDF